MELWKVIRALEGISTEKYPRGIIIADDMGVHQCCDIISNCPKAIQLRKLLTEIGISLQELIDSYDKQQENPPSLMTKELEFPPFSGIVKINIAGAQVEVDLTEAIKAEFKRVTDIEVSNLAHRYRKLQELGISLHNAYLNAIQQTKRAKVLPQLDYPIHSLIKYKCTITRNENTYLFIFPIQYKPQWIYTHGERYAIDPEDVKSLIRDIYVVFPVTSEFKIMSPYLITESGSKFQHYHGRGGDCWGNLRILTNWDRNLKSLADLAYQVQAALATLNYDSIMNYSPPGLIDIDELKRRSKLLGEEGTMRTEETPVEEPPRTRGWGRVER